MQIGVVEYTTHGHSMLLDGNCHKSFYTMTSGVPELSYFQLNIHHASVYILKDE
jgi:hypothetical protein